MLADADLVAARQLWRGTHGGKFMGLTATGKEVEFSSTAILRVADGLIVEAWDEVDVAGLMGQFSA